jgi:hypothetical protein
LGQNGDANGLAETSSYVDFHINICLQRQLHPIRKEKKEVVQEEDEERVISRKKDFWVQET